MPVNTLYQDGDNAQLRGVIFDATPTAIAQTKQLAQKFKGKTDLETCKNIYNFLKYKIRYKEDGFHQKVKLPSALLREKVGDCKSYSVFTYAILTNLGIPCKYVLTSYNNDPTPSHIYVCTDSGIIIDAVWNKFNSEKKPNYKFYKKVDDMRISTISGIKGGQIKGNCYNTSTIGTTAGKWYSENKSSLGLKLKDKIQNATLKISVAPARGLFRKFIEQNGGGIATSIYRRVYIKKPIVNQIPKSKSDDLKASFIASAKAKGVKFPTQAQQNKIGQLSSVQVEASELSSGALQLPTDTKKPTAQFTLPQAWDRVMGGGQYTKYQNYYAKPLESAGKKLLAEYTIPASKQSAINAWKKLLIKWYKIGGNPYELYESVMEGKNKTPRGKDANYMLMTAKTRGLQAKDFGLIIRGFVSAFGGERFNWGQTGTYIFGYNNSGRIGEPSVVTTVTGYITLLTGLLKLLAPIFESIKAKIEQSKAEKEMEKLETSGYMLESDYLKLPTPRPKVIEVKQLSVPELDAPNLEDIGSAIEEIENAFKTVEGKKDAYTPQTKEQYEAKKKEGSFSPVVSTAIDDAKTDKGTADYLKLVSSVSRAVPEKSGDVIITYLKVDVNDLGGELDDKKAGFGGIILPLLIGGGVLMALNTAKKQKK